MGGQSNARGPLGFSSYETLLSTPDAFSAWPTFAAWCARYRGADVAVVNTREGGSSQTWLSNQSRAEPYRHGSWDERGTLFDRSVAMLDSTLATRDLQLAGVIWDQGLADANAIDKGALTRSQYERALVRMIARYRERYGATPFFIIRTGRLTECLDNPYCTDGDTPGLRAVRAAQVRVAERDPLTHVVYLGTVNFPARGLMQDNVHYSIAGLQLVGRTAARYICSG